MPKNSISWPRFVFSMRNAGRGFKIIWIGENSFRIQIVLASAVVVLGIVFNIAWIEWAIVVMAIGMVLGLEAANTVVERLADFLEPHLNHKVAVIKDMMSGAVLLASIAAAVAGLIIFLPRFLSLG